MLLIVYLNVLAVGIILNVWSDWNASTLIIYFKKLLIKMCLNEIQNSSSKPLELNSLTAVGHGNAQIRVICKE